MEKREKPLAAVVTGASSGIGLAIGRRLCGSGYHVFGIGRNFTEATEELPQNFHCVICDLLDTGRLTETVREIRREYRVCLLVNNAGVGYYGLHEEIAVCQIQEMVRLNLEVPMILSQIFLRDLKRESGTIVNISSVTAEKSNPHGCAYGATKAGLSGFSHSLFDEARKYGLRVVTIQPDMTQTGLYRHADFTTAQDQDCYLLPEEVADAVCYAIERREGMAVTDITLKPQRHKIQKKGNSGK